MSVAKFVSSCVKPWQSNLSSAPDFSMNYGLYTNFTKEAERIQNSTVRTVVKISAFPIDAISTLFGNLAAFLINNTFGRIYNSIIHIQNKHLQQKDNNWKIKNFTPFYLAAATVGICALVYLRNTRRFPFQVKLEPITVETSPRMPVPMPAVPVDMNKFNKIPNDAPTNSFFIPHEYRRVAFRLGAGAFFVKKIYDSLRGRPGFGHWFLKDHTILHGLDNDRIITETAQNNHLTFQAKLIKGVEEGAKDVFRGFPFVLAIGSYHAFNKRPPSAENFPFNNLPLWRVAVQAPVVEELIFRFCVQNAIYYGQKFVTYICPESIKNRRTFQWLTSPSARILASGSIFAACHAMNPGCLSGKIVQVGSIFFGPCESILYETTGSLIAPLASHMTSNFILSVL
jgi:hypothetical protein